MDGLSDFEVVLLGALGCFVLWLVISGFRGNGRNAGPRRPQPGNDAPSGRGCGEPRRSASAVPVQGVLRGRAWVIDGDTIVVQKTKIRLAGIDAPELHHPYGQKSKWAMVEICKGQTMTVTLNGETSYDRLVGTCVLPDGRDIGAELIKQGHALDYTFYSGGKYRAMEASGARRRLMGARAWAMNREPAEHAGYQSAQ